jgi:antitoxin component YwqK of YwqJK toxin-antitoxin module
MSRLILIIFSLAVFVTSANSQSINDSISKEYFYPDQTLKQNGFEINGLKEGTWFQYTEKGWLRFEWTYENGKKHGPYRSFFESGKVAAKGTYKNGKLEGTVLFYNENGELIHETEWSTNGDGISSKLISQKSYNPNAKKTGTIEEIDGKKYVWLFGKLSEVEKVTTYDKDGNEIK